MRPSLVFLSLLAFLRLAYSQSLCGTLAADNEVVVTDETIDDLESLDGSLQDLVDCLEDGGRLLIDAEDFNPGNTLQIRRDLEISSTIGGSLRCGGQPALEIRGPDVRISNVTFRDCELDGEDEAPVIVREGSDVSLSSVSFMRNSNAGGPAALLVDQSRVSIEGSRFVRCRGEGSPVVSADNGSSLSVTDSTFEDNSGGSAVRLIESSELEVSGCEFRNNEADSEEGGAAICVKSPSSKTIVSISDSVFEGNVASNGPGGALLLNGSANATIDSSVFRENEADRTGGAISVSAAGRVSIGGCSFVRNVANLLGGGAVYAQNSSNRSLRLDISLSTFSRNLADNHIGAGGALRIEGTKLDCKVTDGVYFLMNKAYFRGGAIYVGLDTRVTMEDATFVANEAINGGAGAIFALSEQNFDTEELQLEIFRCRFSRNRALYTDSGGGTIGASGISSIIHIQESMFEFNDGGKGSGGCVYLFNGPSADIVNCTFRNNTSVWAAALYGENEAKYNVTHSRFEHNSAQEGGAVHLRADVGAHFTNCTFIHNKAVTEGGAVKVLNSLSSGDRRAEITVTNCTFHDNSAGSSIAEDFLGTRTRGGAAILDGAGIELLAEQNTFENNQAAEGGAVSIRTIASCRIDKNSFATNFATYGGSLFFLVDERVKPDRFGNRYYVENATFQENVAWESGGAVYVGNSKLLVEELSVSPSDYFVQLKYCEFVKNRCVPYSDEGIELFRSATDRGGAMTVSGTGVELEDSTLERNFIDRRNSTRYERLGGAMMIEKGGVVESDNSNFTKNSAAVGGAVMVIDSALYGKGLRFEGNEATGDGVGGAVAIEMHQENEAPIIDSMHGLRPLLLECFDCIFHQNKAGLRGGALHVHDHYPQNDYSHLTNCTEAEAERLTAQEIFENPSCSPTFVRRIDRLKGRAIRFQRSNFTENEATYGGAIFSNNAFRINVTDGINETDYSFSSERNLSSVILNDTVYLTEGGTFFEGNKAENGYGPDYATTPVNATLNQDGRSEGNSSLEFLDFQSGARLNFSIGFVDALGQEVTQYSNLSAEIVHEEENPNPFAITGEKKADIRGKYVNFTGTTVRGDRDQKYRLKIEYSTTDRLSELDIPASSVTVKFRPCRVGEFRDIAFSEDLPECNPCPAGQFNANSSATSCTPCNTDNAERTSCTGNVVIPDDGQWIPNSYSTKAQSCIGHDSCRYGGRKEEIMGEAEKKHNAEEEPVFYTNANTLNSSASRKLCAPVQMNQHEGVLSGVCLQGYEGLLCGSCRKDHGREGHRCRLCASPSVRVLTIAAIAFWAFIFVACFISSVIQLKDRIELNKKFSTRSIPIERITGQPQFHETIPDEEDTGMEASMGAIDRQPLSRRQISRSNGSPSPPPAQTDPFQRQESPWLRLSRIISRSGHGSRWEEERKRRAKGRLCAKLKKYLEDPDAHIEPFTLTNPASEVVKILINFIQVTSVAVYINVDWTKSLRRFLYALGAIGSATTGSGYTSLDCFMSHDNENKTLIRMTSTILFPIAMLGVFVAIFSLKSLGSERGWNYFKQRAWLTYLAINYFVYIGLTKNLLRFFACPEAPVDVGAESNSSVEFRKERVWEEDSSVACFEEGHALILGLLVVPLLMVVSIGYPLSTFCILAKNKDRLDDEEFVTTYGFLYRAYDLPFWEVVIMIRKLLIAVVAVFAYHLGETMQALLCVLIMVAALAAQLTYMPFTKEIPSLNRLEAASLLGTVIVFVVGMMMNDDKVEGDMDIKDFLSVMAIVIVVIIFLWILFSLMYEIQEVIDMKIVENNVMPIRQLVDARYSLRLERLFLHYVGRATGIISRIQARHKE